MPSAITSERKASAAPMAARPAKRVPAEPEKVPSGAGMERWLTWTFVALVVYAGLRAIVAAGLRPLWFDEICTWNVVRQPGLSGVWNALLATADGQPPMFYLVERVPTWFFSKMEYALRLPSVLGFCATLLCIFAWVKTRAGALTAWIAASLLLFSPLRDFYAVEARPYAMVTACIAFALVCYQRIERKAYRILFGVTLVFAASLHYYAIFFVLPFAAAELSYALTQKRVRAGVWAGLSATLLPLVVSYPLVARLKAAQGANFWARPDFGETLNVYSWLSGATSMGLPVGFAGRAAVALSVALVLLYLAYRCAKDCRAGASSLPESVLLLALFLTPWVMFAAVKLTDGGLTTRYMVPVGVVVPLVLAQLVRHLSEQARVAVAIALLVSILVFEVAYWSVSYPLIRDAVPEPAFAELTIQDAKHAELPVLVSNPVDYLQLVYYATPKQRARLVEPFDTAAQITYARTDTTEKNLAALAPYIPMNLPQWSEFRTKHSSFLLFTSTAGRDRFDWWIRRFTKEKAGMQLLAGTGATQVFLVTLPEAAVPGAAK